MFSNSQHPIYWGNGLNDLEWAHSVYFVKRIIRYRALTGGYIGGYPPRKLRAVLKGKIQSVSPCMDQRGMDCAECSLRETCYYSQLMVEVTDKAYLPYFIDIGSNNEWKGRIIPGNLHTFEYSIVGEKTFLMDYVEFALRQKPYIFLHAADPKKIHFELDSIHKVNEGKPINLRYLLDHYRERCAVDLSEVKQITIELETPFCATRHSKTVTKPNDMDFATFFKILTRRILMLAESHCGFHADCPEPDQAVLTDRGIKTSRSSDFRFVNSKAYKRNADGRKDEEKIGGFKDRISFEGNLTPLFPLIVLGEALHIGNDTTQGHGKYSIVEINGKKISLSTR